MNLATRTVRSAEDLKEIVATYGRFGEFAFDIETRGHRKIRSKKDKPALDARTNVVWSLSLAGPGRCDVIPCGHPDPRQQLRPAQVFDALAPLFFSDRRKVNQNVGFDLLSIAKYFDGEIPPPPYGDTLMLVYLLNENLGAYNLGALTQRYLGYTYSEKLGEAAYTTFFEKAVRYSIIDAKMAWLIWWKFRQKLARPTMRKLEALFDLEMDVLGVLLHMRRAGAFVDVAEFQRLRPELEKRHATMRAEIVEMVGHEINLNSPPQLGRYLYDELKLRCPKVTDKGARSTDASVLTKLATKHPAPHKILEFKDVQKMLSTYIAGYMPHIDDDDRIRASFNQARAKTGRLSCSDPNLQNIPARYKETFEATMVRRLFTAPTGKVLIVADYSQIELRILAHQTKDYKLVYAYTHDQDLHTQTASLIWRVPQSDITKRQRDIAKNSNFNFAFEGGPGRVVEMSGISLEEAEAVYEAWHQAYPGVKKWGKTVKRFCWQNGYVETLFGRKRRLPEITSEDWKIRGYAERQAVNHPIQGTAADIAKVAMVRVHSALQDFDAALVLQVHDEFIIEVAEAEVDDVLPLVETAMEDIRDEKGRPVLDVPLKANITFGSNWAACK